MKKVIVRLLIAVTTYAVAAQVTYGQLVQFGTLAIKKSAFIIDQNIGLNVPNQILGGFRMGGEDLLIKKSVFTIESDGSNLGTITNIRLYNGINALLAGPVDATFSTNSGLWKIEFTDPFVVPKTGEDYIIRGTVGSPFMPQKTIRLTSKQVLWTVTDSLDRVTLAQPDTFTVAQTMTLGGAAIKLNADSAQTRSLVGGMKNAPLATFTIDASESSEDVRLTSLQISFSATNTLALVAYLTNCRLFDGVNDLSGLNVVQTPYDGVYTFTLVGTGIIVSKGTSKTLTLRADLSAGIPSGILYLKVNSPHAPSAVGVTSVNSASILVDTNRVLVTVDNVAGAICKKFLIQNKRIGFVDIRTIHMEFQGDERLIYYIKRSSNLVDWNWVTGGTPWGILQFVPDNSGMFSADIDLTPEDIPTFFQVFGRGQ
jgi:hypothetical protein